MLPKFSALDSESALDSIDSKFLRVVFSRIFSNFLESLVCAKEKGVLSPPRSLKPRKSLHFFGSQKYIFWRESLAFPLLAQSLRRHSCLLSPTIAHHEAGERWYALTRYISHLIFAAQKWRNFAIALSLCLRTHYYLYLAKPW